MIEAHSWPTPNGHKVHVMLEECALPYKAIAVDIGRGDRFRSDFLAISPNNKVPAIVDPDGPYGQPIALYLCGPDYSIADIAVFPWLRSLKNQGIDWDDLPHLKEGSTRSARARPCGVEVLAGLRKPLSDDKAREVLFGKDQCKSR